MLVPYRLGLRCINNELMNPMYPYSVRFPQGAARPQTDDLVLSGSTLLYLLYIFEQDYGVQHDRMIPPADVFTHYKLSVLLLRILYTGVPRRRHIWLQDVLTRIDKNERSEWFARWHMYLDWAGHSHAIGRFAACALQIRYVPPTLSLSSHKHTQATYPLFQHHPQTLARPHARTRATASVSAATARPAHTPALCQAAGSSSMRPYGPYRSTPHMAKSHLPIFHPLPNTG